jgi:glucose/mannose-6-phosphate isomerase
MLDAVLGLPVQCREGYRLGRAIQNQPDASGLGSVVVCGMGGSGVVGDVLRALYRDRLGIPIDVVKDSVLPEFCGKDTLVVCSSFSGNTAETVACFEAAVAAGCRVVAMTSGGELAGRASDRGLPVVAIPARGIPKPRAALGLLVFGAVGALEQMGLVPGARDEVEESIVLLDVLAAELRPGSAENPAVEIAEWLGDRPVVVWGAEGIGAVAATRWKTQLNENAKTPAFASSLPELDHNEIVGWTGRAGERFALVAIRHEGERRDVAARFSVSMEIAAASGLEAREVRARGRSSFARFLSVVMLGDATSVYLGLLRGHDPTPIENIDRLKRLLDERPG